jgi:hypothetical protein
MNQPVQNEVANGLLGGVQTRCDNVPPCNAVAWQRRDADHDALQRDAMANGSMGRISIERFD